VALARDLARRTDQVVFSPALTARPFVERGDLVEIPVDGWDVGVDVYLACAADRVRAGVARRIRETLRRALGAGVPAGVENGRRHPVRALNRGDLAPGPRKTRRTGGSPRDG
jgi:hypothetical protein